MNELLTKDSVFKDFPDVVNIKQFQEMMGVSKKTAYGILKEGEIAFRKIGREYRIPKINIINYLM